MVLEHDASRIKFHGDGVEVINYIDASLQPCFVEMDLPTSDSLVLLYCKQALVIINTV